MKIPERKEKINERKRKQYARDMKIPERKEKIKERHRKNVQRRRQTDPIFRLQENLRGGLWACLSGQRKNSRTMRYVDMTPDELMDYLEERFTEGMSRHNYGEWHIDHIRPKASFDFTGPDMEEQLHIAWHYTNLQPLWARDNLSKGTKYEEG